ncbi:MAG TPA: PaaI family thioesterase [Polyangiaceae bacterium]|jgi:acyl-coenzyme A thioesterase PaaI-like protein|nr:PaaI family thioesterase [Polyangiaceae bacterium]
MTEARSLQETYAPKSICFGCGPANTQGLRIRSFVRGDVLECRFTPAPHHHAFPGVLNGGIIGTLLDCHSNWASVAYLMRLVPLRGASTSGPPADAAPCTVTAEFAVKLKRPTPMSEVLVSSWVVESDGPKVTVEASLEAAGKITATCRGVFVQVDETHPAYHRW